MNYIQRIIDSLSKRLPDCGPDLLAFYALLTLSRGTSTSLEDVHDAWAAWRNTTRPDHAALIPFNELDPVTQELDRKYAEAIRLVASELEKAS